EKAAAGLWPGARPACPGLRGWCWTCSGFLCGVVGGMALGCFAVIGQYQALELREKNREVVVGIDFFLAGLVDDERRALGIVEHLVQAVGAAGGAERYDDLVCRQDGQQADLVFERLMGAQADA